MADDILKNIPLPADLPENWTSGQIIAPTGAEAGLDNQHGYNYLMKQVNNAQKALKVLAAQREEDRAKIKFWVSPDPTSPAELFGGTWEQIKDRFILAAGDTYAAGSTGGEAEHTLTINEIAAHSHAETKVMENGNLGFIINPTKDGTFEGDILGIEQKSWQTGKESVDTGKTGGSDPHNNMPPYLTVYVWKRVA